MPAFLTSRGRPHVPSPIRVVPGWDLVAPALDAAALPMAGIAPRRLIVIGATIVLAWTVIAFGRQVAEASAASSRADALRAANVALASVVAATERELEIVQEPRFVAQAARAYRLGTVREVPFALEADAPPLAPDAPGSAAVRLGAAPALRSPLASWLDVLFGPGR